MSIRAQSGAGFASGDTVKDVWVKLALGVLLSIGAGVAAAGLVALWFWYSDRQSGEGR